MTTQEYNDIFKNPVLKQLEITSSGGVTITNSNIVSESMSLEQSLCSEENLRYGRCEASCFRIRIADMNHDFTGEWLDVTMKVVTSTEGWLLLQDGSFLLTEDGDRLKLSDEDIEELEVNLGHFKVYSDKPSNDRRWRDLVCYDRMYDILNADVTSWYNGLTFPMTILSLRTSFFNYLGITQKGTGNCINDYFNCYGGFETETFISGKMIVEAMCELFGCFGHISADDEFQYMHPGTTQLELDYYQDGTGSYEDYATAVVTGIKAIGSEDDVGTSVGTTTNVYVIENNPLIYGSEGTQALTTALNRILEAIRRYAYRPFSVTTYGNPMLPLGQSLKIVTKNQTIYTYVINKTMTGIQSLKDTYSALGEKKQPSIVNAVSASIKRTKGKVHDLRIDVDELTSEISEIDNSLDRISKSNVAMYECTNYVNYTVSSVTHKCIVLNVTEDDILNHLFEYEKLSIGVVFRLGLPAQTEQIYLRITPPVSSNKYIPIYYCHNGTQQLYNQIDIYTNSILYFQLKVTGQNQAEAQVLVNASTNSIIEQTKDSILLSVSNSYVTQASYDAEVQNLQDQIDGRVDYWDGNVVPTLSNAPASSWSTDADKSSHVGDLYRYHHGTPEVVDYYRFDKDTSTTPATYNWVLLGQSDVDEALRKAEEANAKADALADDLADNYYTATQTDSQIALGIGSIDLSVYETKTHAGQEVSRLEGAINVAVGEVVLKADNNGNMVLVALGTDPDDQSAQLFQVTSDNILLSAQKKLVLETGCFEVDSTYLQISSTGQVACTSMDIDGGDINLGNGVFHVTNAGHLTCTSAEIEGEIVATSGSIGDLALVNGKLTNTESLSGNLSIDTVNGEIEYYDSEEKFKICNGKIIGYNYLSYMSYGYRWYEASSIEMISGGIRIGGEAISIGGYLYNRVSDQKTYYESLYIDEFGNPTFRRGLTVTGMLDVSGNAVIANGLTVSNYGLAILSGGLSVSGTTALGGNTGITGTLGVSSSITANGDVKSLTGIWSGNGSLTSGERQIGASISGNNFYLFANTDGRCGVYSSKYGGLIVYNAAGNKEISGNVYVGTSLYEAGNRVLTQADRSTNNAGNTSKVAFISGSGICEISQYIDFHFTNSTADRDGRFYVSSSGGNHFVSSLSIQQNSSEKAKKNIADIEIEEADKILLLRPRMFDYKRAESDNQAERGFIAEEVMDILPNLVRETDDEESPYSLDYNAIIPYLVKVIQKQQRQIDVLTEG